MIVNARLNVSDDGRRALARLIDGKETKRLATRKEVREFVFGCVDRATNPKIKPREPDNPSYMNGWNQVGERYKL